MIMLGTGSELDPVDAATLVIEIDGVGAETDAVDVATAVTETVGI